MSKLTLTDKAGVVSLGRVFEKVASVATMMVLSRAISRPAYGLYWSVWTIYFLCLPAFQSGFPAAVIFYWPKVGVEGRKQLVLQNLALLSLSGMAFSAVLFFGAPLIVQFFRDPPSVALLRAFSLFPLFVLPTLLAESVLLCADRPVLVAITSFIARAVPFLVCVVGIAVLGWSLEQAFVAVAVTAAVCLACILPVMLWPARGSPWRWQFQGIIDQIKFAIPMGMSPLVAEFIHWTGILIVGRLYDFEWFAVFRNGAAEVPVFPILAASATAVIMPQMAAHTAERRLDLMMDV
jgi:O-antigen/teichoic acid export membrane protein